MRWPAMACCRPRVCSVAGGRGLEDADPAVVVGLVAAAILLINRESSAGRRVGHVRVDRLDQLLLSLLTVPLLAPPARVAAADAG